MPYRMSPGRTRYFFARSSGPRHLHRLTPPFAPRRAADLKDRAGQSDWAGPFELNRFRATSAAAAAPKSRIMGGAGTGVPPVELLLVVPPLLLELELEEVEVELLVDEDVEELRSEEHTSELQSLMRISYAVFCLEKKKADLTTR